MRRRIVITGLGVVTPIGIGIRNFWESCLNGKSGVAKIRSFNTDSHSTKIAAEVKDDELFSYIFNPKDRLLDRFSQFALVAMEEALTTSKLNLDKEGENEITIADGQATLRTDSLGKADLSFTLNEETFDAIMAEKITPLAAKIQGKIKSSGNIMDILRFASILSASVKQLRSSAIQQKGINDES